MQPPEAPNLRQRKKIRTRAAIRDAALKLFLAHGYANTTVDQIVEEADVSARTFYRYFGVKEALLICDQFGPIVAAFIDAPRELSPVAAYRYAVDAYFAGLTDDERHDAIVSQHLLYNVPEARGLLYTEYVDLMDRLTDALVHRLDGSPGVTERRVIAGAIVGVLMAASDGTPLPEEELARSFDFLEAKFAWK
ncbi:TetR family transcriptional regulator [Mycobacterium sp. 236(2023)]|uniref:TetR/AcrR family transcriptional regulator n=1 Tax=Mycobacterium sp. 236(2023) TaxID=3038163 RepID=UPI0024155E5E|nr:TetR family transcriptional regulator [Mycobacterium sp. 236(2023)]MDG4669213.1 TetR family transcriptional regulator [Mycobacterium sp. 236(2023)]